MKILTEEVEAFGALSEAPEEEGAAFTAAALRGGVAGVDERGVDDEGTTVSNLPSAICFSNS